MLAAPLKIGIETPTYKRLKEVIKSWYGKEKIADADDWLIAICTARKRVLSGHKLDPQEAICLLKQYYRDFEVLTKHIKFTEQEKEKGWLSFLDYKPSCSVKFEWCDAYSSESRSFSYFPGLEKGAVLWNIAALYSSVALKTDQSLKGLAEAVKLLKESAGAFSYISQSSEVMDSNFTPDLSRESCQFMAMLMIAQAQAIFVTMATTKKMSSGLVAKLAQGGAFLFTKTYQALEGWKTLVTWLKKSNNSKFILNTKYQQLCLKAKAQFWQAKVDEENEEYGQEIGRLRLALQWLNEAGKMSQELDESIIEQRKLVSERLIEAEKDNNEIYHYKVLSLDDLPVIPEKVVCQEKDFLLDDIKPMESPFEGWVPEVVSNANDKLKNNLLKRKELLGATVSEQTDVARALMASLGLPAKLDATDSSSKGLPDAVWSRIDEFQKAGGMNRVCQMLQTVSKMALVASSGHKEILRALDWEKNQDDQLRQRYGKKWGCVPSEKITKNYRDEGIKIEKLLAEAEMGNKTLQTELTQNEMPFLGLCASREDLSCDIPSVADPSDSKLDAVRDELSRALTQLGNLLNDREKAFKKYCEDIAQIDMTDTMMSGSMTVKKATEMVLSEFKTKEEAIGENIKLQKHVIMAVESADKAFNEQRNATEIEKIREAKIHELNETVTKYNKLCKNFEDGIAFYNELRAGHLKPLQDSVGDFITARKTERDMLLEDLNMAAAKNVNTMSPAPNFIPNQGPAPALQYMVPHTQPSYPMAQYQHPMAQAQAPYPMAQAQPPYPMALRQAIHLSNQTPQPTGQLTDQQAFSSPPYGQPSAYGQPNYGQAYQNQEFHRAATFPANSMFPQQPQIGMYDQQRQNLTENTFHTSDSSSTS